MHADVSRLMQADQAIFDHIHDFVLRCGDNAFQSFEPLSQRRGACALQTPAVTAH
jgi:hypothetical protein